MTELEKALGSTDQDVMNFKAGIDGLVFSNFTDAQIAAFAVEEAQQYRKELQRVLDGH